MLNKTLMNYDKMEALKNETKMPKNIEKSYSKKVRALKIIHNLSEFLKVLSIKEGDILKSMLVKFACEAVDATRGSLLLRDAIHKEFYYHDTAVFNNGRPVLKDFNEELKDIRIKEDEGHIGKTFKTQEIVLIEKISKDKDFLPGTDEKIGIHPFSLIAVPMLVDNEFLGVLEIVNEKGKDEFDAFDIETIVTIANIAGATMENAKLFKWAISDGLTQIFNVHFFKRMLEQEIKKVNRYGGTLSIMMLDIDHFKSVNDTYGHQTGDKVLQKLSEIVQSNIRAEIDLPGRYGGDEFIVMLPSTDIRGAKILCDRLLTLISSSEVHYNEKIIQFTSSIGAAEFVKNSSIDELIKAADNALYFSKKNGRNQVTIVETY